MIEGVGPRYCPSIEDKVVRFAGKDRHPIFVEPCGENTEEMYLQGASSSLPEDVQNDFYHSIVGFERLEIIRPAYAIEYDCVDPTSLTPSTPPAAPWARSRSSCRGSPATSAPWWTTWSPRG